MTHSICTSPGTRPRRSSDERHDVGGTIWTGGGETDALLIEDGTVVATGAKARGADAETVDLGGGFLMPSFGDGHAHPLYGGRESVGPPVRQCHSVDEIVTNVAKYAADNPGEEWIVGASYDSGLATGDMFDARWLDAAVPDRPVVLRAGDCHTVWCNSEALRRAGITADTPQPFWARSRIAMKVHRWARYANGAQPNSSSR